VFRPTPGTTQGSDYLEIVAPDAPLKQGTDQLRFSRYGFVATLMIRSGTGALVYCSSTSFLYVPHAAHPTLPWRRFRADPEDPNAPHRAFPGRPRSRGWGRAEIELNRMARPMSTAAMNPARRWAAWAKPVAKDQFTNCSQYG